MDEKKNEIILFENQGVRLEVNLKDETVWLTQKQMAELFGKDRGLRQFRKKCAFAFAGNCFDKTNHHSSRKKIW